MEALLTQLRAPGVEQQTVPFTPLRVFDDALNNELNDFNPFDRTALAKLIRQMAKARGCVVSPFSAAAPTALLGARRPDERPMLQFWFATGLRPGELQALEWRHIDWDRKVARVEQNQVAGVIKAPKTAAGIRAVDLDGSALAALQAQRAISEAKGASLAEPAGRHAMVHRCPGAQNLLAGGRYALRRRLPQPIPSQARLRLHPTHRWAQPLVRGRPTGPRGCGNGVPHLRPVHPRGLPKAHAGVAHCGIVVTRANSVRISGHHTTPRHKEKPPQTGVSSV